jgi:hypothetical protein
MWTRYLHLCGQVISLMMSVLPQKLSLNEDRLKGDDD